MRDFLYFAEQSGKTYLRKMKITKYTACYASKDGMYWYRVSKKTHDMLLAIDAELQK